MAPSKKNNNKRARSEVEVVVQDTLIGVHGIEVEKPVEKTVARVEEAVHVEKVAMMSDSDSPTSSAGKRLKRPAEAVSTMKSDTEKYIVAFLRSSLDGEYLQHANAGQTQALAEKLATAIKTGLRSTAFFDGLTRATTAAATTAVATVRAYNDSKIARIPLSDAGKKYRASVLPFKATIVAGLTTTQAVLAIKPFPKDLSTSDIDTLTTMMARWTKTA